MANTPFFVKHGLNVNNFFTVNNTTLSVGSNAYITGDLVYVGNSTVNSTINSTTIVVGTTIVNNSVYFAGNSTVNSIANTTTQKFGNSTVTSYYGLSGANVGANVVITVSGVSVGNATINVNHTATSISVINTIANVTITPLDIKVGNTTSNVYIAGGTLSINGQTNLPDWAAIATSTKQAASANLTTYSTSANIAAWHGLATSAKQDASANLSSWSALATSAKQDASANLTTYSTSANIAAWHALATSAKQNTLGYTPVNVAGDTMTGNLFSKAINQSVTSYGPLIVQNASGTGDSNAAVLSFLCQGYYARNIHLRADGYMGISAVSSSSWTWYVDPSGNMVAAGNVTAYSDPKLKERFEKIKNALGIVSRLNGGTFYWKHGIPHIENKAGKRDYGILANEVEAVMPEIVSDSISLDGESYKTVSYEKLVPVLIEAIKELKAEIDTLKNGGKG